MGVVGTGMCGCGVVCVGVVWCVWVWCGVVCVCGSTDHTVGELLTLLQVQLHLLQLILIL